MHMQHEEIDQVKQENPVSQPAAPLLQLVSSSILVIYHTWPRTF